MAQLLKPTVVSSATRQVRVAELCYILLEPCELSFNTLPTGKRQPTAIAWTTHFTSSVITTLLASCFIFNVYFFLKAMLERSMHARDDSQAGRDSNDGAGSSDAACKIASSAVSWEKAYRVIWGVNSFRLNWKRLVVIRQVGENSVYS